MKKVTLIGPDFSSYLRSVRLALEEKGVDYEISMLEMTDIADLKNSTHLGRHPFGKIPVLIHGDQVIFETIAILEYIDEAFPGPNLMQGTAGDFAKQRSWMSAFNSYAYQPIVYQFIAALNFDKIPEGHTKESFVAEKLPEILDILMKFEQAYGEKIYLTSDEPGLADMLIFIMLDYLAMMPFADQIFGKLPKLDRMKEAFRKRPSYAPTLPASRKQAA